MNIWTLTHSTDEGISTSVHFSAEGADTAARQHMSAQWSEWARSDAGPCPFDWQEAYERLCNGAADGSFGDQIMIEEHSLDGHPDLGGALDHILRLLALIGAAGEQIPDTTAASLADGLTSLLSEILAPDADTLSAAVGQALDRRRARVPDMAGSGQTARQIAPALRAGGYEITSLYSLLDRAAPAERTRCLTNCLGFGHLLIWVPPELGGCAGDLMIAGASVDELTAEVQRHMPELFDTTAPA